RGLLAASLAAGALALPGCTSTVPGAATAAGTTSATTTSSSSSAPSSPSPSPTIADEDLDETLVCVFLDLGFIDADSQYLDWQAATAAGTPPPVPTEQVAAALDQAVADNQGSVAEAPEGAVRTAGQAVLDQATALGAAMRSGGGLDATALSAAFDQLDAACPG
ncbi:MAG: hypothetical protein JWQ53_1284, partial [Klenkia sp.]|nr:hypothetical protein [Klenkia sp.]